MGYRYDATNVKADLGFPIITKPGWFPFRVAVATPGESKKTGAYQVTVDCLCMDPNWRDYTVRHWVTFLPPDAKGAGMAIHFLKAIGEPHEGILDIDPMAWERKMFMGKVVINEYKASDGTMRRNNKFEEISPMRETEDFGGEPPEPVGKTVFED